MLATLRRLVPLPLRARVRDFERAVRTKALVLRSGEVRPTPVPLDDRARARLVAAFPARVAEPASVGPDFPDEEALLERWDDVRSVVTMLARHNRPDDKYFDWSRVQRRIDADPAFLSKDLFVAWLAREQPPRRVLEIGARTGRSLAILGAAHRDPAALSVVAVDPFVEQGTPRVVQRNADRAAGRSVALVVLVGPSNRVLPALVEARPDLRFDYVLVDGSHDAADALADLRAVAPLVARGGYVVFDDIGEETYSLLTVWEQWIGEVSAAFEQRVYLHDAAFAVARRVY